MPALTVVLATLTAPTIKTWQSAAVVVSEVSVQAWPLLNCVWSHETWFTIIDMMLELT